MADPNKIFGIDKNWVWDGFLGIMVAVGFFLITRVFGIVGVIGIPSIPAAISVSDLGAFLIIVVAAAIFETVLFQEFILDFFDSKLGLSYIMASIFSSLAFSLFHITAYANLEAQSGSFIVVFIWGMLFCYLRKYTKSILAVITAHGTTNFIIEFIINRGLIFAG